MFSKTLGKAEQACTTWERELLVVVRALEHFRSVTAGMTVYIHTDHLNNTSHNTALSYPDKILRMLLKVESLVTPVWMFEPGGCQFGDGLSRNPEGRDQAREEAEGKKHLPATLGEAFELVTRYRLEGTSLIDDAEEVTQCVARDSASPTTRPNTPASPMTRETQLHSTTPANPMIRDKTRIFNHSCESDDSRGKGKGVPKTRHHEGRDSWRPQDTGTGSSLLRRSLRP